MGDEARPNPRTEVAYLATLVALAGLLAQPLLLPIWGVGAWAVPVVLIPMLVISLRRPGRSGWLAHDWMTGPILTLSTLVIALGGLEVAAQGARALGWVEIHQPMRTLVPAGSEDWRLAHITADHYREADPLLFWRPVARYPYNAQRMKGPLALVPKPKSSIRILCYGDSNTDGPDEGGWPELLGAELARRGGAGKTVEVLNAGVAGYSSHQGLLRFRAQVEELEPDWVVVSFGWNDVATASGPPDRHYAVPPAWRVRLTRFLLQYTLPKVVRGLLAPADRLSGKGGQAQVLEHRVPVEDYRANLLGFVDLARARGAQPVLLTRPYRASTEEMKRSQNWRRQVPRYNHLVRRIANNHRVLSLDVEAAFAGRPEEFGDGCHFSPAGHARMASLLADRLEQAGIFARFRGEEVGAAKEARRPEARQASAPVYDP